MPLSLDLNPAVCTPAIHLNGTSVEALLEQQADVLSAIAALRTALANAGPNGRDYYVRSDTAASAAIADHRAELALINELAARHEAICEGILSQQGR